MYKLYASLVMALTCMVSANICADSIELVDQKNVLSIDKIKFSEDQKGYIGLHPLDEKWHLYVDGISVYLVSSYSFRIYIRPVRSQCNYAMTLGQDNSLKLTAGDPRCTSGELRAAAPPYKVAGLYKKGELVSFINTEKGTAAVYACFNDQVCGVEAYGPEQALGDEAWVLISKRYIPPEKNQSTQDEDTFHLTFHDYKHGIYLANIGRDFALNATLVSKKDPSGYLNFYVDNKLITLALKNIRGEDCDYEITLNQDNSIFLKNSGAGCTQGYVRKPSGPYDSTVSYKKGDIVIEQNNETHLSNYYECVISSFCNLRGYAPKEPNGHLAWIVVYTKMFHPKKKVGSQFEEL